MALNNNAMYTTLIEASAQRMGDAEIDTITLEDIVDTGKTWSQIEREQWAGDLISRHINTIYTTPSYSDSSNDVFYEDSAAFGAITQIISMEMPDIIENRSWTAVTSGVTTIGANTVYLPIVDQQLFASTDSWAVPVTYTGTQLNAAFDSKSQLMQFDNYVKLVAENAIRYHRATMNMVNRNNYIAEKLNVGNSAGKINVVNLVEEYAKFHGLTSMTVNAWKSSPAAIRYSAKTLKKYKGLLSEMSTLFTTKVDSKGTFVPQNRLVMQVLEDFEAFYETEVYSQLYHDEFVKLPLFRRVKAWQGLTGENASASFDELSTIDVKTADGHTVTKSGIVAFMVDKWAIMHTMVQNRVGYQRDDIKDITLYDHQFTDRYINNLTLPGIIFTLEDYTAPTETT